MLSNRHRIIIILILIIAICVVLLICLSNKNENANDVHYVLLQEVFTITPEERALAEHSSDVLIDILILENTTYTILSSDERSIELEITAPNMHALFSYVLDFGVDISDPRAEYDRITSHIISSLEGNFPTVTSRVIVGIELDGEEPTLIMCENFWDAIYGGMLSFFNELIEMGVE